MRDNIKTLVWYNIPLKSQQELKNLIINSQNTAWFDLHKLEKDFYLTIFLIAIGKKYKDLIFKWWTCLNKIYFDYYRLSEDLDFVHISDQSRKQRKKILEFYKQSFSDLFWRLWFNITDRRTKYNEDMQWIFEFEYKSIIDGTLDKIKVDIRIEPRLQRPSSDKNIIAIYQDPIMETALFQDHTIRVMDLDEIFAEKTRAALTRIEPAIRDFFDIHYAIQKWFDFKSIKDLIDYKVSESKYRYTIDNDGVFDELNRQIKTELEPVLKNDTDYDFDLQKIYNYVLSFKKPI